MTLASESRFALTIIMNRTALPPFWFRISSRLQMLAWADLSFTGRMDEARAATRRTIVVSPEPGPPCHAPPV
jgi:hypothetical protein